MCYYVALTVWLNHGEYIVLVLNGITVLLTELLTQLIYQ